MTYAKNVRSGFSLIEIMIAVSIAAAMAAFVASYVFQYWDKSKVNSAKITLKQIQQAIEFYNSDVTEYPETLKDLVQKPSDEKKAQAWQGPYLKEVPKAPWGKFQYQVLEGQEHPYELYFNDKTKKKISVWNA